MEKEYVMMEPPIDDLVKKCNGSKYLLTCLVAKRAKELASAYFAGEPQEKDPKVIAIAAQEIMDGKIIPGSY